MPRDFQVKDSGNRRKHRTGGVRDKAEGKGRMDLLPFFALEELSIHFENGAKKYGENNWLKGLPLSWYLDSALRHLIKAARGQTDEPHLAAAAWNVLCLMDSKKRIELGLLPKELDNMLPVLPKEVQNKL